MYKILITDPISEIGTNLIRNANIEVLEMYNAKESEIKDILPSIDGWIIRSGTNIDAEKLKLANKLQVIGRAGVGIDNIDVDSATKLGVLVMNMPDGNTISAAEHTMAMLSAISRNIQLGHLELIKGNWNRHKLVGSELKRKKLGVIGLGRIGREVIKRALSYDMEILGYDPYVNESLFDQETIKIVTLDYIIENSDYITVHVPLNENTDNLFNYEVFKKMKNTARIVNVARGGIINEKDLSKALNEEEIAGAALDVYAKEPLDKNSTLLKAKNILLTPHLGASTLEAKEGVSLGICNQVIDFLINNQLSNVINTPFKDSSMLAKMRPYLDLCEKLGRIQFSLSEGSTSELNLECYGKIDETRPLMLSFIKGFLSRVVDLKINFINATNIAEERGITITQTHKNESINYKNLVRSFVKSKKGIIEVSGVTFGDSHYRIVNILGFEIDFKPQGNILFIQNQDIPGVVGKVGTILGDLNINIGEYILSRKKDEKLACSIIRIDGSLSDKDMDILQNQSEIIAVQLINLL